MDFYEIKSGNELTVDIGEEIPLNVIWSNRDDLLFFSTLPTKNVTEDSEWKDVIRYRLSISNEKTNLHQLNIRRSKRRVTVEITHLTMVDVLATELLYSASEKKLIFSSTSALAETAGVFEIYTLDLMADLTVTQITNDGDFKLFLELSQDGRYVFFMTFPLAATDSQSKLTQSRLYSIDLRHGSVERWVKDFDGSINGYATRAEGGIFFLGQKSVNVQIYIQQSPSKPSLLQHGWNGTYNSLTTAKSGRQTSLAFVHSSFEHPEEVYFVNQIDQLSLPKSITNENEFLTKRFLPSGTTYQWKNTNDNQTIEGVLHYPPGKFGEKNLPLLVWIHGGPGAASLDSFAAGWYTWAQMAATEGWLVLEPNYRGSHGYGDDFTNAVRFQMLSGPGKDILDGVDRLVADGIADPKQLNVGGFSYGGYLTNWLITQTTRFNAALSGAGAVDQTSNWGTLDLPVFIQDLLGALPWENPQIYLNQSALFQMNKVQTPTLIVTGAEDIRVPIEQSLMLERSLKYFGVPVELLLFPNEGHAISNDPWHGKIMVRENLRWLEKYGRKV